MPVNNVTDKTIKQHGDDTLITNNRLPGLRCYITLAVILTLLAGCGPSGKAVNKPENITNVSYDSIPSDTVPVAPVKQEFSPGKGVTGLNRR